MAMLRVGIIGSGFGVIGLLPAFAGIAGCEVVALCAKESDRVRKARRRFGIKKIYSDWELLLANEKLDVLALAVPPDIQYEIGKAAIRRGLHVFAEKPLTANLQQAQELLVLAEKHKITHGIDFIFQEISAWKKVKELIDKKIFGKLEHVSVNWDFLGGDIEHKRSSWKTSIARGGGALSFYFSHGLYYLEYFAGRIIRTKGVLQYSSESLNGGEVKTDILLEFQKGVIGNVQLSCNTRGIIRHRLAFQCQRGVIVLENRNAVVDSFSVTTYSADGVKNVRVIKDKNRGQEDERVKIVRKLATRFISACKRKKQISPSFKDGLRVQELIEIIRSEAAQSKIS
jgi:predicted dehydrogenase